MIGNRLEKQSSKMLFASYIIALMFLSMFVCVLSVSLSKCQRYNAIIKIEYKDAISDKKIEDGLSALKYLSNIVQIDKSNSDQNTMIFETEIYGKDHNIIDDINSIVSSNINCDYYCSSIIYQQNYINTGFLIISSIMVLIVLISVFVSIAYVIKINRQALSIAITNGVSPQYITKQISKYILSVFLTASIVAIICNTCACFFIRYIGFCDIDWYTFAASITIFPAVIIVFANQIARISIFSRY